VRRNSRVGCVAGLGWGGSDLAKAKGRRRDARIFVQTARIGRGVCEFLERTKAGADVTYNLIGDGVSRAAGVSWCDREPHFKGAYAGAPRDQPDTLARCHFGTHLYRVRLTRRYRPRIISSFPTRSDVTSLAATLSARTRG
jgi:hypothetical protein